MAGLVRLPSGRVDRRVALAWGLLSTAAGLAILAIGTNPLTTGLSLFVTVLYVVVYTPLKVRTPLNTVVGAVVGVQPFGGRGLSGTGPKAGGPNYLARFGTEYAVSNNTAAVGGNASLLSLSAD